MTARPSASTYQGPREGFRGEVYRAALRLIRRERGACPCGERVAPRDYSQHADDCVALRDDAAAEL